MMNLFYLVSRIRQYTNFKSFRIEKYFNNIAITNQQNKQYDCYVELIAIKLLHKN